MDRLPTAGSSHRRLSRKKDGTHAACCKIQLNQCFSIIFQVNILHIYRIAYVRFSSYLFTKNIFIRNNNQRKSCNYFQYLLLQRVLALRNETINSLNYFAIPIPSIHLLIKQCSEFSSSRSSMQTISSCSHEQHNRIISNKKYIRENSFIHSFIVLQRFQSIIIIGSILYNSFPLTNALKFPSGPLPFQIIDGWLDEPQ